MAGRNLVCTFCKRSEHVVRKLVAGPNVFICDQCTDRAHAFVHEGEPQMRAAPQLLVDDLERALAFYRDRLGFATDFVYEGFYAAVSRDGAVIHLKCAPKLEAERAHRRVGAHLDAYLDVRGVRALHADLLRRGAPIHAPLTEQAWGQLDFSVVDPDGYILCFSESAATS